MLQGLFSGRVLAVTAKIAVPIVCVVLLVGVLLYRAGAACLETARFREAEAMVAGVEQTLGGSLMEVVMDLRFLTSLESGALPADMGETAKAHYLWFMRHKSGYDTISSLAGDGSRHFSLTRSNHGNVDIRGRAPCPGPGVGPESSCPVAVNDMWPGCIYITGPDHAAGGDIVFTTAMGSDESGIRSILVLGCPVRTLLHRLETGGPDKDSRSTLVLDGRGQRLDRPGGELFNEQYPAEWAAMKRDDRGFFRTDEGLFAFASVDPGAVIDSMLSPGTAQAAGTWTVAARINPGELDGSTSTLAWTLFLLLAPLTLMLAGGAWGLAYMAESNRMASSQICEQHVARERFVPREFLDLMGKERLRDVDLSTSVQREMTILFSDIRSYTKISESLPPEEIFKLLNDYFSSIDTAITARHGFIDKFIGDAVMALFRGSVNDALLAAISMRQRIDRFNEKQREKDQPEIVTGFGIHFGEVTLGSMGTVRRMQTTAIGDAVNLAARLESATKVFQVGIIISDAVYDRLYDPGQFQLRRIDTVRVKGKDQPVRLYEAYDVDTPELAAAKEANSEPFERAMDLYAAGDFDGALELFTRCAEACPEDPIPAIYVKRCSTMKRVPPGDGWTGISTL